MSVDELGEDQRAAALPSSAGRAAVPVVAGVVVVFALLVAVIWRTGVFDEGTSASDAQIVGGMLTLLGGLVASSFTLVGLLLKHSIDRHSARLAHESERSRRLEAREVEARLRLETSIKAVELLTLADGTAAPSTRQAGALFVLGSHPLQQLDLAVALLRENWREGDISSSAAVWVIDRALAQPDPDLQRDAAWSLHDHADLLPNSDRSFDWPRCADLKWPAGASYFARVGLLHACVAVLALRGPDGWNKGMTNWFIAQLDVIRRGDDAAEVHAAATLVLDVLLEWALRQDPAYTLYLAGGNVHLGALRQEIAPGIDAATQAASEVMADTVAKLRADWAVAPAAQAP